MSLPIGSGFEPDGETAMNNDTMIYFVMCQYKSGPAWAERDPANMSRRETVIDIRSGELPNVLMVLECNPVEGICHDVTEDVIEEANQLRSLQAAE
jgi:hypothetical protein